MSNDIYNEQERWTMIFIQCEILNLPCPILILMIPLILLIDVTFFVASEDIWVEKGFATKGAHQPHS